MFADYRRICTFAPGELAEWSIAAVLKTVELWKVPGVRIPNSPPPFKDLSLLHRVKGFFMTFILVVQLMVHFLPFCMQNIVLPYVVPLSLLEWKSKGVPIAWINEWMYVS